jgi:predicted dinucleotide-utilizing enzyme
MNRFREMVNGIVNANETIEELITRKLDDALSPTGMGVATPLLREITDLLRTDRNRFNIMALITDSLDDIKNAKDEKECRTANKVPAWLVSTLAHCIHACTPCSHQVLNSRTPYTLPEQRTCIIISTGAPFTRPYPQEWPRGICQ